MKLTLEERIERDRAALARATQGASMANFVPVIAEFSARGIPVDEIRPKENVLTYPAWRALGRQVRRGEHGVKITVWIPSDKTDEDGAARMFPKYSTVFHVSQTDELEAERRRA